MIESIIESKKITRDIPTEFTVNFHYDDSPDISWMGHFAARWEPGAIDRVAAGESLDRHAHEYWIPTPGCENWQDYQRSTRAWYTQRGYSKHESSMAAHMHRAADYRRIVRFVNDDWHFMGIEVVAPWGESDSLWGIESDSGDDNIEEIITDLIDTLIESKTVIVKIR